MSPWLVLVVLAAIGAGMLCWLAGYLSGARDGYHQAQLDLARELAEMTPTHIKAQRIVSREGRQ